MDLHAGSSLLLTARRRANLILLGTTILALAMLAGPTVALGSHSATVHTSASTTGSSASISATRDGWGAIIDVAVRDTKSDGKCAFAIVYLGVSSGSDPSRRTENCHGNGSVLRWHYRLGAGLGTGISTIKVKACRNVPIWPDNCSSTTVTLPQMFAHGTPERIAATDAIMELSLDQFEALKDTAPSPYDWEDDGCSVPDWSYHFAFNDACERHDFGYRNFGGSRQYLPSDSRRSKVDSTFLADMKHICTHYSWLVRPVCYAEANAGYGIVRIAGGSAFFED